MDKYRTLIKQATTKEELHKISYQAFLKETPKVSNKVDELCIKREIELGLLHL